MDRVAWTDDENDLIVADYFAMLADELAGHQYIKAEHNRQLQSRLGRTRTSIEFKHQNISAVLKGLGEDWIIGYKPAFNFQNSLEDAVLRWMAKNPSWIQRIAKPQGYEGFYEPTSLWVGPPPTLSNYPEPLELEKTLHLARKYDVAGRDERNRILGRSGEELVIRHERSVLGSAGRSDLAQNIRWVSEEDGDGAGYDIASFTPEGRPRLIEVKTTNGWDRTPFYISDNELTVAQKQREDWCLFRLWNFSREPKAFELRPPLDAHVKLTATTFRADFR